MFSNGAEYMNFQSAFCERCKKFNEFGMTKEDSCPIEYQISKTNITGCKEDFPYSDLKPINKSCRYACKSFESDDKDLMESYKKIMDDLDVDGEQLYDPVSGQTVGELENLTPEQLNNLLRKENNRDKEVITAERNCNDR